MKAWMIGALLLAAPGAAFAQDEYDMQVLNQLVAVEGEMNKEGWVIDRDPYLERLDENEDAELDVPLERGVSYTIVGACDNDCSDVDFYMFDPSGAAVAEDTATDDIPIVSFVAQRSGDYRLRVRMYDCASEPCRYGVAVFTQ